MCFGVKVSTKTFFSSSNESAAVPDFVNLLSLLLWWTNVILCFDSCRLLFAVLYLYLVNWNSCPNLLVEDLCDCSSSSVVVPRSLKAILDGCTRVPLVPNVLDAVSAGVWNTYIYWKMEPGAAGDASVMCVCLMLIENNLLKCPAVCESHFKKPSVFLLVLYFDFNFSFFWGKVGW